MAHSVSARLTAYTAAEGQKFGLTVGLAFGLVGLVGWWRELPTLRTVALVISVILVTASLIVPRHLGPVDRAWMKLAMLISRVTTPVLMGAIYFLVLTPFGAVRRALGKNSLVHRAGPSQFWADRSETGQSSLERQF